MARKYIAKIDCTSTDERDALERTASQPEIRTFLKILGDKRVTPAAFTTMLGKMHGIIQETLLDAMAANVTQVSDASETADNDSPE